MECNSITYTAETSRLSPFSTKYRTTLRIDIAPNVQISKCFILFFLSFKSGFYTIIGGNLTLQSVHNTGSSTNYDDSVVTIKTDVYVNSVDSVTDGEQHAVIFKLYDGGTEKWSRNVMFTMQTAILVYGLSVAIALGLYMFVNCLRPENFF